MKSLHVDHSKTTMVIYLKTREELSLELGKGKDRGLKWEEELQFSKIFIRYKVQVYEYTRTHTGLWWENYRIAEDGLVQLFFHFVNSFYRGPMPQTKYVAKALRLDPEWLLNKMELNRAKDLR